MSLFDNVVVEVGRSRPWCGNRGLLLRARVGKSCFFSPPRDAPFDTFEIRMREVT